MTTYLHHIICPKCKNEGAFRSDEPFDFTAVYTMGCNCGGINEYKHLRSEVLKE